MTSRDSCNTELIKYAPIASTSQLGKPYLQTKKIEEELNEEGSRIKLILENIKLRRETNLSSSPEKFEEKMLSCTSKR